MLGSAAVNFALVWWLTAETGSALVLTYASIGPVLPQALVGPLAGPFVDRWDRRLTMIGADLFVAGTSVVLVLMFALGTPSVVAVMVMIAARSLGAAFHTPAGQAAIPSVDLARAAPGASGAHPVTRRGHARVDAHQRPLAA